jgi:Fic family protein
MKNEFFVKQLPPDFDVENVVILKALNAASRALGELRGEVKKIPNSQILIDTISLQEAKDSNEVENIVTTDDELYQSSVEFDSVSQAAKETQNYAKVLKLRITNIKEKSILVSNYKTKKAT